MIKGKLLIFPLLAVLAITIPITFADKDELEENDQEGFGIMEREREREHQDEGIQLDAVTGSIILYGTIAAIVASIAYTAFKMIFPRRKSISKS